MNKTFQEIIEEVKQAGSRFDNRWDIKTHYIDLVEEVGELGNAILIEGGDKSPKRKRAEVQDSFADILFELILMADEANIDLEQSIGKMLAELKIRQDKRKYE